MSELSRFFGVWMLDAQRLDYGDEPPPRSGVYTVLPDAPGLWFHARWLDAEGERGEVAFRAHLDQEAEVPGQPDLTVATRLEDGALITETLHQGQAVHTAWRRLDELGHLVVRQRMPSGAEVEATYTPAPVKQVLVYRRDLKMRKGKIAAQCAHASMAVFFRRDQGPVDALVIPLDGPMAFWAKGGFAKVVLSVEDEPALDRVVELAKARGLPHAVITDSGKTEFHGVPTRTAAALGPAAAPEIDAITGPGGAVETKLA